MRPDFDNSGDPDGMLLVIQKCSDLIKLQLFEYRATQPTSIESKVNAARYVIRRPLLGEQVFSSRMCLRASLRG